jgi:hypothetical protein
MNTRDAYPANERDPASASCHTKDCAAPAIATCERCGRRLCATHSRQVVIQRREERAQQPARRDALAHLPTQTETYILCVSCRSKPMSRDLLTPALSSLWPGKSQRNT